MLAVRFFKIMIMAKKVTNKLLKLTTKFMLGIPKRKELEDLAKF